MLLRKGVFIEGLVFYWCIDGNIFNFGKGECSMSNFYFWLGVIVNFFVGIGGVLVLKGSDGV